jgi:hypothetical protein
MGTPKTTRRRAGVQGGTSPEAAAHEVPVAVGPVLFQSAEDSAPIEVDVEPKLRPAASVTPHPGGPRPGGASLHVVPVEQTAPGHEDADREEADDEQAERTRAYIDRRSSGRARPRRVPPGVRDYDPAAAWRRVKGRTARERMGEEVEDAERVPIAEVYRWLRIRPASVNMLRHRFRLPDPDQDGCYDLGWLLKWGRQNGYFDPVTMEPRHEELEETVQALEGHDSEGRQALAA